jgi:hypothetical protein
MANFEAMKVQDILAIHPDIQFGRFAMLKTANAPLEKMFFYSEVLKFDFGQIFSIADCTW